MERYTVFSLGEHTDLFAIHDHIDKRIVLDMRGEVAVMDKGEAEHVAKRLNAAAKPDAAIRGRRFRGALIGFEVIDRETGALLVDKLLPRDAALAEARRINGTEPKPDPLADMAREIATLREQLSAQGDVLTDMAKALLDIKGELGNIRKQAGLKKQ